MTKILCAVVAIVLGLSPVASSAEKRLWAKSFLGKKAPELQVEGWISKKPDIREDQFVLIDFWATWCPPCRKAIPELNAFHKEFQDKLVVIGISDEKKSKIEGLKDPQIEYYSAYDTKATLKKIFEVRGIPHVVIINPQGIVVWEGFPMLKGHELTKEVMESVLEGNSDRVTAP